MSDSPQSNGQLRRIVIVGLGSIGRRHARLLRQRPDLRIEVCEPSGAARDRAAREIDGLTVHADLKRALATRPEMLLIATPHSLHADQVISGLQSGADVLCEKPLCMAADEAVRIVTCARDTGRTLAVGFQLHFQPCMLRAREIIRSGAIGTVVHAHARVGSYITLRNSLSRYQEAIEGSLLLDYSHQPDLLFWLLNELPCGVALTGLRGGDLPLSSDPNVLALTLDYHRPLLATVHLNYVQMPQRHEWEIVGDKGWFVINPDQGTLRLGLRETEAETLERFPTDPDLAYIAEHQAFLDSIDGLRLPESPADAAARSVELFAMAMRSWKQGRRVACEWADFSESKGTVNGASVHTPAMPFDGVGRSRNGSVR